MVTERIKMITICYEVMVSSSNIEEILEMATSGCAYWCKGLDVCGESRIEGSDDLSLQLIRGGQIAVTLIEPFESDDNGNDITTYSLDEDKLLKGIKLYIQDTDMPYDIRTPENGISNEMIDSDVADIIMQYALFDEVVFS